jgi:hypothetical protein
VKLSPFGNPWPEVSFGYQDQVGQSMNSQGLRTYLRNQAEYADEKHYDKPQPLRWDHRVNLEYDHAGMSAKWAIKKRSKQRRGTHTIVEIHTHCEAKKERT